MARRKYTAEEQKMIDRAIQNLESIDIHEIVNKDPEYEYVLAAQDERHPSSVQRMKYLGYEVVNAENNSGEYMPHAVQKDAKDGPVVTESLVLMRIPKFIFEERQLHIAELGMRRRQQHQDELVDVIQSNSGAIVRGGE